MFSELVLCLMIVLAFCCIALLYIYHNNICYINYLEQQLDSLKCLCTNQQANLIKQSTRSQSQPITTLPNENGTNEQHINSTSNPLFHIVRMATNPIFTTSSSGCVSVELDADDIDVEELPDDIDDEPKQCCTLQNECNTPNCDCKSDITMPCCDMSEPVTDKDTTLSTETDTPHHTVDDAVADIAVADIAVADKSNKSNESDNFDKLLEGLTADLDEMSEVAGDEHTTTSIYEMSLKDLRKMAATHGIKDKKLSRTDLLAKLELIGKPN